MVRISIGSEAKQLIPQKVLEWSITRRTSRPVEFTSNYYPDRSNPISAAAPKLKQGTKFSEWRWLVPKQYNCEGKAIYLDADQIVLSDIGELWDSIDEKSEKWFSAVVNAIGVFGNKIPELNKVQTSVMCMNLKKCNWDFTTLAKDVRNNRMTYAQLMQAAWVAREFVVELDPAWNHFGIVRPGTKLVHFSHVSSQPYRRPDHPHRETFQNELRSAVFEGYIEKQLVFDEIAMKHLHPVYGRMFL